jgi:hypothetical protein
MLLGKGSGGWISINLKGVFIAIYIFLLIIHIIISTIAVLLFKKNLVLIHIGSFIFSLLLIFVFALLFR